MPHQFMSINCKKCKEHYCPVCNQKCPMCGELNVVDEKTMANREQMRQHMNRKIKKK